MFEIFAARGEPLTLSQLSRLLSIPVSTCFNLMRTLQERGYLYEVGGRKTFYPTARWLQKANAIAAHDPVVKLVRPHLEALRNAVGETVILSKQFRDQIMLLDVVEGLHSIRYTAGAGDLKPLHSSASGKAVLGALPAADRDAVLAKLRLTRTTAATITDRRKLVKDIERGAKLGWFLSRGENVLDVMGLSTPLAIGGDMFVIAIIGPIHRMDAVQRDLATKLLETKRAIERRGPSRARSPGNAGHHALT